jgi:signal transduction histidine kinase
MKVSAILIPGGSGQSRTLAEEAVSLAFPGAGTTTAPSLDAAAEMKSATGPQFLILLNSDRAEISRAAQVLDRYQLPRWAVVARGTEADPAPAEVVPAAEWDAWTLKRILKSAMSQHLLRRENERFRRDLLAVGIRVTHDLRSPLGGILASAEAMGEADGEKPLIRAIFDSTADVVKVIDRLAVLTKATASPVVRQSFSMDEPLAFAMMAFETKTRKAHAVISKAMSWPQVTADRGKVESIWVYLIDNALRHAGKGPHIELSWDKEGDTFRFWIRDNGLGVKPEIQKSLFQPFHLLNEPNAPRGLGLPIVERLVHLQGGTCGYEPRPGGGSSFYFTLPGD